MGKLGGGSLFIVGILIVIFGAFIQSGIVEALLNIAGLLIIAIGVIAAIVGLVQMLSGDKQGSSDF